MSKLKKALNKAKKTREESHGPEPATAGPDQGAFRSIEPSPSTEPEKPPTTPPPVEPLEDEVHLTYKRTKVIPVDREQLDKHLIISYSGKHEATERFKILRAQIMEKMKETGGNTLLITSPNPNEGKTLCAINLAVSLSQEVHRTTLLVDADLRSPDIQKIFGLEPTLGLSNYLLGEAELPSLFINPGIEKLTILPAGPPLPSSTELLGAPRMKSLVIELKSRYRDRFIIIDTSALLTTADPLVMSDSVDGIILVIEAERTTNAQIERSLELLKGKPLIGALMNKIR